MRFGAHLPLIDFDGVGFSSSTLGAYVDAARDSGFDAVSANDHLVFQRPWLDGLVALASIVERAGALTLATTVALPVIRGPVALAGTASALADLSDGRFVLGVGPGSSAQDYAAVGVPYDERWARFDAAVRVLRSELADSSTPIPIWIGSWGSAVGLARVARLGDGWLASAYNTTAEQVSAGRRALPDLPVALATNWTYLTDSKVEAGARLASLAAMLGRDPEQLADRVLIGDADTCVERLRRYAVAGVDTAFIWPLGEPVAQLERFAAEVAPQLG
jgi:alkanesulfonate monooxygenase SsuD/methylene tetrahydromethanopterin reductase-like flavin-dependent oxidoreductase (luciferase family)